MDRCIGRTQQTRCLGDAGGGPGVRLAVDLSRECGMDAVSVLLALGIFALMFGLIRAMERI